MARVIEQLNIIKGLKLNELFDDLSLNYQTSADWFTNCVACVGVSTLCYSLVCFQTKVIQHLSFCGLYA